MVVGGGRNALTNAIIDSTNAIIWFLGIPGTIYTIYIIQCVSLALIYRLNI